MRSLSARELKAWLDDAARSAPVLLDVREPWEFAIGRIEGSLPMPMHTITSRLDELAREAPVVAVCQHGARSLQVGLFLERNGFVEVYNLEGGLEAWSQSVDPAMPKY